MSEVKYPMSVLRGYKPPFVRYIWHIMATDEEGKESEHCGMTHGGITNLTGRGNKVIQRLKVADLVRDKVYEITDIDGFLTAWGENYFDADWRVPIDLRK